MLFGRRLISLTYFHGIDCFRAGGKIGIQFGFKIS